MFMDDIQNGYKNPFFLSGVGRKQLFEVLPKALLDLFCLAEK